LGIRTLIIAPHIDDEILGCASILNPSAFICYLGVEDRSYVTAEERKVELKNASLKIGFSYKVHACPVNNYSISQVIPIIESTINEYHPGSVFIPNYSYNQDHKTVYDAAMVALRHHDQNWFVKKIFVYEQPHDFMWPVEQFNPNYFIPLNLQDKIDTYKIYASQVRNHRSPEMLISMAKLRGAQANIEYAEAFQCIRFVPDDSVFFER
jgi:LmbE family N-acetylglucosaminyl deacetylase